MPRSRPISLSVMPDADLDASDTAQVVLQAYTTAMTFARNEQKAFDTAVWAWRKRHPKASPEDGEAAVAYIICHNM
jgi:hypothetical protein